MTMKMNTNIPQNEWKYNKTKIIYMLYRSLIYYSKSK